ncbi:hypothetical protein V5028_03325 [Enterobacter hormaechei]|uniref:hypothetical protein n=1 Tax=Enterobacter hormaechei TaxID=158836 RepID=UPI000F839041|nr:hypothetical protein [Enterobacter hormaechei]MCU2427044.1 hypothetical protein [Enterobacter hormaechei subsp. hoffmannii]ELC7232207.1 hypothetical protein [Enterobacter hormaechei]MBJ6502864.1 hypothetical protein [Enterobacter hormaechei]MCU2951548.1 hypothetical protein [Enterobacter hormaechei subsp. hoffmannii]MCU3341999.1 hypothetical protein [Enterobacter hormaechei subsp. hoffmannii]
MYYSEEIIKRIGTDKELAVRLDKSLMGVKQGVVDYVNGLGDATTRLLYYTSCLTDNYQDVCKKLGSEDIRFICALYELIKHRDIIFRMLKIYIETILKNKNETEKKTILQKLTPFTTNYSIKYISKNGLIYAVASYICYGNKMNLAVQNALMKKIGSRVGWIVGGLNIYGIVQHAAESADNLKNFCPLFYNALYMEGLEMMYFLIEPIIMKSGYLNINTASDEEIVRALKRMM